MDAKDADPILKQVAWLSREINKQRRVVVCNGVEKERIQEVLDLTPYGSLYTLQASAVVAPGVIYLIDPNQMHVAVSMPPVEKLFASQDFQDEWRKLLVAYTEQENGDRELTVSADDTDVVGTCSRCAWTMHSYGTDDVQFIEQTFPTHDCRNFKPKETT